MSHLFLVSLGLHWCSWARSLVVSRGFSLRWLLLLQSIDSRHQGFSSCGIRAQLLLGMWDLPRLGIKPVSPALAGKFQSTIPPEKSSFVYFWWFFFMAQLVKNPPAIWETWVRSLSWKDPLEKGKANLQYSGLENSMDCIVHRVTNSQPRLSNFHFTFPIPLVILSHYALMCGRFSASLWGSLCIALLSLVLSFELLLPFSLSQFRRFPANASVPLSLVCGLQTL